MKIIILFALFFINLINGTYLLVEVDDDSQMTGKKSDSQRSLDKINDSVEPQCTGKSVANPRDICNNCTCTDDGCVSKDCTSTLLLGYFKTKCPGKKKPGQLCSMKLKNCVYGHVCADIFESCNNDVGECTLNEKEMEK